MENVISLIKETIKNNFDPDKIILFGSYAYGNPGIDSDYDILVIIQVKKENVRNLRLAIRKALRNIILKYHKSIDIIVDSEQRIKKRIKIGDSFIKEITEKGKLLYAK